MAKLKTGAESKSGATGTPSDQCGNGCPAQLGAPPGYLCCPLSGQLMAAPTTLVETGQTFEKSSITYWLEQGHRHCPVSGMKLYHCGLIENFALQEATRAWAQQNGVRIGKQQLDGEYDWVAALVEEQFKGMYTSWAGKPCHYPSGSHEEAQMLGELACLLHGGDCSTQQAAAASIARICAGNVRAQSVVGDARKGNDGAIQKLVVMLGEEVEKGKPGHAAWALAELCRHHPKNQARILAAGRSDIQKLLVQLVQSGEECWNIRGARLIGCLSSGNQGVQNTFLLSTAIESLVSMLRSRSDSQVVHGGLALMHMSHGNKATSMEALKNGALLHASKILLLKNLSVKIVGCGLISHLFDLLDYGWGVDLAVLESILSLLQQFDDGTAVVGASAMFKLVRRGKVDLLLVTKLGVLQRILQLLRTCSVPGYHQGAQHFLIQWAKFAAAEGRGSRLVDQSMRSAIQQLTDLLQFNIKTVNEIIVNVNWILVPLNRHYHMLVNHLKQFERLAMDATMSQGSRAMSQDIVSYVHHTELEQRSRVHVVFASIGMCLILRLLRLW